MSSSRGPLAARFAAGTAPAPSIWLLDDLSSLRAQVAVGQSDGDPAGPDDGFRSQVDAAYHGGFEEGRRAGAASEAARLRSALEALAAGLEAVHREGAPWVANLQERIAAVVVAVAHRIIGREIAADATGIAGLVRQALLEFPIDQSLVIRLHPADLSAIASSVGALPDERPGAFGDRQGVQWVPDDRVARGGCLVEGRDRVIDGRVDTALERIYRQLSDNGA